MAFEKTRAREVPEAMLMALKTLCQLESTAAIAKIVISIAVVDAY